jgi:hypothetical protein
MPLPPLGASCALLVGIALADYLTGYELSLQAFYVVPAVIAAWRIGRVAGIVAAAVSAGVWCGVDWLSGHRYVGSAYLIWNGFSVFAGACAVVWIVTRLRPPPPGPRPGSPRTESEIEDAASAARAWMRKGRPDSV